MKTKKSYYWKYVIKNMVPNTFLHYEFFKYMFLQHFLNYNFHIILKINI